MKGGLRELALFAGAGGGILGGYLLGWETVCAVEIEDYPRRVLLARQRDGILPRFPIWDDIRTFDGKPWRGRVDVVSGGFPCPAWSSAARGRNTAGTMWPEMLRVVGEVCPRFVFAENVIEDPIAEAQADLEDCGYRTARIRVRAQDVGADHPRRRWWLFADADDKGELGVPVNAEVAGMQERRSRVWDTRPDRAGMVDRVSDRVDRYCATGRAQVPAVVSLAWQILSGEG